MPDVLHHLAKSTPAGGTNAATRNRPLPCENGATSAKNDVARQRARWITP